MRSPSDRIFISYKSENANEVRYFVERLMAAGADVWFAEYEVRSTNYESFQENIDREVESAIDASGAAIAFTNDRWAGSRYCLDEIERILDKIPHERIVQVCMPKEDQPAIAAPLLKTVRSIEYRSGDTSSVLAFIERRLDVPGLDVPPSADRNSLYLTRFGPLLVDCLERKALPPSYDRVARTHLFRFEGQLDAQTVSLDLNVNPYRTSASPLPLTLTGVAALGPAASAPVTDDRQIYSVLRRRAESWYKDRPIHERGLHLFSRQNRGQLALTYRTAGPSHPPVWHRTYVLIVEDPLTHAVGEVDLEFAVAFPNREPEEALRQFCDLLPRFDAIASSFDYRGDLVEVHRPGVYPSIAVYAAAAGVVWLVVRLFPFSIPQALLALVAAWLLGGRLRDSLTRLSLRRQEGEEELPGWDPNEIKSGRFHGSIVE